MTSKQEANQLTIPAEVNQGLTVNPELWPRFTKVKQAIGIALAPEPFPGVDRDFGTLSWGGFDAGIHDHKGSVTGVVYGIKIKFTIEGVTVDNQPKLEKDEKGQFRWNTYKETHVTIDGNFVSADGFDGAMKIVIQNGKPQYEAYWLTCHLGHLRLEQVVDSGGNVSDANKLKPDRQNKVKIPNTDIVIESQRPKIVQV